MGGGAAARRRAAAAALLAVATACPLGYVDGQICSGHGRCAEAAAPGLDESCVCDYGFSGPDCSQRLCPAGRAWTDYATANDTAHGELVECSNVGECDREEGLCECRDGFDGQACERMRCPFGTLTSSPPRACYGYGKCLSMREAANQRDFVNLQYDAKHGSPRGFL